MDVSDIFFCELFKCYIYKVDGWFWVDSFWEGVEGFSLGIIEVVFYNWSWGIMSWMFFYGGFGGRDCGCEGFSSEMEKW